MFSNGSGLLHVIIVAAIGYRFVHSTYRFKYKAARKTGQHFYLMSVAWGIVFTSLAAALGYGLTSLGLQTGHLSLVWEPSNQALYVHAYLGGLALSWLVSYAYNLKYDKVSSLQVEAYKSDLDQVVFRASAQQKPLQVTLDTRKVYIGMVLDSFEPSQENSYLTLIPIYSGHRTEADLEMTLTNQYPYVKKMIDNKDSDDLQDLGIVIPKDKIVTCHIFNLELYQSIHSARNSDA